MTLFRKIISYAVVAIQILILVLLIFENEVQVPLWLQSVGRVHPLFLHLPIGIILITAILVFLEKQFTNSIQPVVEFFLLLSAFCASLTTFFGLLLSFEGGYNDDSLIFHKWFGVGVSFICWMLISFTFSLKALKPLLALGAVLLIVTGHFGANLTHGENFIFEPLSRINNSPKTLTDSTTLFSAAVEPIFESKCYSCHNEQKAKGRLVLTYVDAILKGGKHGVLWKPGDPASSLLVERLTLPLDAKEHMPPKDKPQLSADEINFISEWIASGADLKIKYKNMPDDSMRISAEKIVRRYHQEASQPIYTFEFASNDKLTDLNTPYRTVFQLAQNEPAVQVDFYLASFYKPEFLEELQVIKNQLVSLNLSKMPIEDRGLKTVAVFHNLEKLILNSTPITGEGFSSLTELKQLKSVSLANTKVTVDAMKTLAKNKALKEIFIWNVPLSSDDLADLRKSFPGISWDTGFQPDPAEKLKLSSAILLNDGQVLKPGEKISLKHNLPGAIIRYTLNGDKPDSVSSPIYQKPIDAAAYSIVKTKAYKDGWTSSGVNEYVFFVNGVKRSRLN
jgi:hypothetical protein